MRIEIENYLAEQLADQHEPHGMVFVSLLMPDYMRRLYRRLAADADISRSAMIRFVLDRYARELAAEQPQLLTSSDHT